MSTDSAGPSRLLRWLLGWTALTTVIFWLPTIRGPFDGPSYVWSLGPFSGAGVGGAYWFPVVGTIFALTLQLLGWRGARFPFQVLLIGWHVLLFAGVLYSVCTEPEDFRFQGDSLGIDVSLVVLGPLLFGIAALFSLVWAWKERSVTDHAPVLPWNRRNTHWLLGLLLLLPIQFVLLRLGAPGSIEDALGVVITILQWMLIGWALRPYPVKQPGAGLRWPSAG